MPRQNCVSIVLMSLVMSLVLSACGGGGGGGGSLSSNPASPSVGILGGSSSSGAGTTSATFLSGTAATGAAIVNADVTVTDSTPTTSDGTTDSAGHFNVDVSRCRFPMLVRCRKPDGGVLFGLALTPGTANVTPTTDLILRLFYKMHGTTPTAAFNAMGPNTPLPSPAQIASLMGFVNASLQACLDKHGIDAAAFNPMSDPFVANGQGYDGVLDDASFSDDTVTVHLTGATQTTTYSVDTSGSEPTCTHQTSCEGNGGEHTSSQVTTYLPSTPQSFLAEAMTGVDALLHAFTGAVNARGGNLTDGDILPFLHAAYLHDGNDRATAAALFAEKLRGKTITAATVRRVVKVDAPRLEVCLELLFTLRDASGEHPLTMFLVCRRDQEWRMFGNQLAAMAAMCVENYVDYRPTGRVVYPRQRVDVRLAHGVASNVTAEGAAFVNADVPVEAQQEFLVIRPTPNSTQTLLRDVFSLVISDAPAAPAPSPGTLFTTTVARASGTPLVSVERTSATTSEALPLSVRSGGQIVNGHALADAHLGGVLEVRWELPHTFAVEELMLTATLRSANFQKTVWPNAGTPRNATSALLQLPTTVNGEPVTRVSLALQVKGPHGERVYVSWNFADAPVVDNNGNNNNGSNTPPPAPTPNPTNNNSVSDVVPIGINLDYNRDWSRELVFVDCMKSARRFGTVQTPWDMSAPVDGNGWPTADFGVVVMSNIPSAAGVYALSCEGRATVTSSPGTSVTNQHYDPATNTTVADVNLPASSDPNALYGLMLRFTNTVGGCRNVRLLRPGYPRNTQQTFHTAFVQRLAPFSLVRFMQFFSMQETQVSDWSQRTRPEFATQTGHSGAAYEYAIVLANEIDKDIWLSIPDLATDDHVRQLARLLRDRLEPGRAVYLEHSNEVWNGAYPQARRNYEAATTEGNAGPGALNDNGQTMNPGYWAWRRFARRGVQISNIFRQEFGDAQMMTRVRPVLASQVGYRYMLDHQLRWLNATYGPPRNYFYAVAGAPYWRPMGPDRERTDLTVDNCLALCEAALNAHFPDFVSDPGYAGVLNWGNIPGYATLARYYGLRNMCYEGGPDTAGAASLAAKVAANNDPRMGVLVERFLRRWYANPENDALVFYKMGGGDSAYGQFQLYSDITRATAKSQAVERVANTPRSQIIANP